MRLCVIRIWVWMGDCQQTAKSLPCKHIFITYVRYSYDKETKHHTNFFTAKNSQYFRKN